MHESATLVIAHVIPWSPYSFSTASENAQRAETKREEITAAQEQIVAPSTARVEEKGIAATPVVRHGDPVETLIALAKEHDAATIVVGRTGDSRVRRAIFGSIPSHLVNESPIPVTVVP